MSPRSGRFLGVGMTPRNRPPAAASSWGLQEEENYVTLPARITIFNGHLVRVLPALLLQKFHLSFQVLILLLEAIDLALRFHLLPAGGLDSPLVLHPLHLHLLLDGVDLLLTAKSLVATETQNIPDIEADGNYQQQKQQPNYESQDRP